MNYAEAMEYINDAKKYGIVPGLDNIKRLCAAFGNPQDKPNIIHIAGTNGKGSTGAFISSILRDAGYSVCRYISPAVFSYEEKFQFNGTEIERNAAADYIEKIRAEIEKITARGFPHPTPFEMETMLAFLYAKDTDCEYAVFESGMGGRYDAVNAISKSRVSVITSIGMDHMRFLGNNLREIAYEKAGIIKNGGTVVSAPQKAEVIEVLKDECQNKGAELIIAEGLKNVRSGIFDYGGMTDIEISLRGVFQAENAAAAIETAKVLKIPETNIRNGLKNTVWRGRFERICENPVIIADGAHNIDAAKRLRESITAAYPSRRINLIIGVLKDKEYDKIAEITAGLADKIYTVPTKGERALDAETLARTVRKYNKNTEASDIVSAVRKCMSDKDAVTVAFGSLSYFGELIRTIENEKNR